jgi:hypothetical protein
LYESNEATLSEFFEKAYWLQRGQFHPENHQKNIDELCSIFPWDRAIVGALYRILPHFDYLAQEAAKRLGAGLLTSDEAFQELCAPVFYYIPDGVKKGAWELHLAERCL